MMKTGGKYILKKTQLNCKSFRTAGKRARKYWQKSWRSLLKTKYIFRHCIWNASEFKKKTHLIHF